MLRLDLSIYPILLVSADIGLAGMFFAVAPVIGVLMTVATLLVVVALTLQVVEYRPIHPRVGASSEV